MGPTAFGPAAALFNSYPLVHAEGVADGLREAQPDKRPFILTRSGFGGLQRASAALWSGDEIGRAHVCTPVTNAHIVCRLLLDKKKKIHTNVYANTYGPPVCTCS